MRQLNLRHLKPFSGFTLLEVLIAVAILAASLLAIFSMESSSLIRARRGEEMQIATMLANTKLAEVVLDLKKSSDFPDEKSEEGKFDDEEFSDYRWEMKIRPVSIPLAMPESDSKSALVEVGLKALSDKLAKEVREVKVSVFWKETTEEERSLSLVTHLTKI